MDSLDSQSISAVSDRSQRPNLPSELIQATLRLRPKALEHQRLCVGSRSVSPLDQPPPLLPNARRPASPCAHRERTSQVAPSAAGGSQAYKSRYQLKHSPALA